MQRRILMTLVVIFAAVGLSSPAAGDDLIYPAYSGTYTLSVARRVFYHDGAQEGWVHRSHTRVGSTGQGWIDPRAPVRTECFEDGLKRPALHIKAQGEGLDAYFLVDLGRSRPKSGEAGNNERWALKPAFDELGPSFLRAKFLWRGRVYDVLPKPFVLEADGRVKDIKPGRGWWISSRDLTPHKGNVYVRDDALLFRAGFADEVGRAGKIELTRDGKLRLVTSGVTFGLFLDSAAIEEEDLPLYRKIDLFEDGGVELFSLPDRLQRVQLDIDDKVFKPHPVGSRFYISPRYLYATLGYLPDRPNFALYDFLGGVVLASECPAEDEFGQFYTWEVTGPDDLDNVIPPTHPWVLPAFREWQRTRPMEGVVTALTTTK